MRFKKLDLLCLRKRPKSPTLARPVNVWAGRSWPIPQSVIMRFRLNHESARQERFTCLAWTSAARYWRQ